MPSLHLLYDNILQQLEFHVYTVIASPGCVYNCLWRGCGCLQWRGISSYTATRKEPTTVSLPRRCGNTTRSEKESCVRRLWPRDKCWMVRGRWSNGRTRALMSSRKTWKYLVNSN